MSVVLEVKEVKKVYGVQNGENSTVALDSVSFNVEKGSLSASWALGQRQNHIAEYPERHR